MVRLLQVSLIASLVAVAACKKQAPPAPPVPEARAPVVAPKAVDAPQHVQQIVDNFSRVHFEYDSAVLTASSKAALDANAGLLQKHADVRLQIQGHCDERGTVEYNLALGNKRAETVKNYLSNQGIATGRMDVISYGEEIPLVNGQTDTAWSQNRRAEFVVTWGSGVAGTTANR